MQKEQVAGFSVRGVKNAVSIGALATALSVAAPVLVPFAHLATAQQAVFSRIDVAGNQRIGADTIRALAGLPAGQTVTLAQINAAQQSLNNSGLFELVEMRPEGGRLVIEVVENPTINRISIEGNRRIKDDALLPLIGSQPRRAYSPAQAEADVRLITEAYAQQGRLAARVEPKIIRRSNNRVDLVFEVREGRVVEVNRISFTGNRVYSDRRLRSAIESRQAGLFRALVRADTFVQDRIEFDKQKLVEFYRARGYVDAQVLASGVDFNRNRSGFLVNFQVQEGQQYRFGEITVESLVDNIDGDEYARDIKLRSGRPFNPEALETTLERMDLRAYTDGHPFVRAVPRITRNDDDRTIDVTFEISRGERLFVERIDIEGNSETLDRVIRRQFRLIEGDPLNRREIARATERIRATGHFESVEVSTRQGSGPDQAVIDVNVEEAPTGSLGFGAGYGTDDGLSGYVTLRETNFLGRGQTVEASISTSSSNRNVALTFIEPAVNDRDLLFGVSLNYRTEESNFTTFDATRFSFNPRVAFPISENGRFEIGYYLSSDEIHTFDTNASPLTTREAGTRTTSALDLKYTLDRTNSPIEPTAGFTFSFDQRIAGLGGDQEFYRARARATTYRAFFNEEVVVKAELEGGYLHSFNNNTTALERFQLGGSSLRGFETYGIGPRDTVTGGDDPLGGNFYAAARVEASFPIGIPSEYGMYGGVFFNAGSVWGLDTASAGGVTVDDSQNIRTAVGISLFWETALGPLRFNLAQPLDYEAYDKRQTFSFTIATRF